MIFRKWISRRFSWRRRQSAVRSLKEGLSGPGILALSRGGPFVAESQTPWDGRKGCSQPAWPSRYCLDGQSLSTA